MYGWMYGNVCVMFITLCFMIELCMMTIFDVWSLYMHVDFQMWAMLLWMCCIGLMYVWIWFEYDYLGCHVWMIMIVEMFCVVLGFYGELHLVWIMYILYFYGFYNVGLDLVELDVRIAWFRSLHWSHEWDNFMILYFGMFGW